MESITNKKILNIVTLCILILVPFLKFFSMNLETFGILTNYDNINPAFILYFSIPFLIFIYVKDIIDKKRKLDIFDYLFYILIIIGIISSLFSINKNLSIFGKSFRHEGLLSIISYYLLFINWKVNGTKEDIKKFIKLIVVIAIINSIYALFQMYTNFNFILKFHNFGERMASGMCGNPNFLGSLIVTVLSILTCKFLIEKKISFKSVLLIILLIITLINCQSTGPILTYIIVILFLLIFLYIKKYLILKKFLLLLVIILLTYISMLFINRDYMARSSLNISNTNPSDIKCETCFSSIKETVESGGNGRVKIWKNSLDIVKKYPIVGVGFDNFVLVYPNYSVDKGISLIATNGEIQKSESKAIVIYDNAHNVYLHTLVSTGLLGLIPYLLLCLLTFLKGLRSKNKYSILLLSGFVAYSVQAFANISVIQVAPIYYIIIGLILSIKQEPKETSYIQ